MSDLSQEQKNSQLLWAVRERRPNEIKRMIAAGAKLECVDENWNSPLYTAAAMDRIEEAEILLKAGAKPNWCHRKYGAPPLFVAAETSARMTELLLRYGADANVVNKLGETPLFGAVRKVKPVPVRLLLQAGADANARNPMSERAPLHLCAELSTADQRDVMIIAEALISARADINAQDNIGMTPLAVAASSGHALMFGRLLTFDTLSQRSLDTALVAAVETAREPEWLRGLLERGADVEQRIKGRTLLQRVPRGGENAEANKRLLRSARTQRKIESAMSEDPVDAGSPQPPSKDFTL